MGQLPVVIIWRLSGNGEILSEILDLQSIGKTRMHTMKEVRNVRNINSYENRSFYLETAFCLIPV